MDNTGFLQIACCQALRTGTGPLDQDKQNLPFNNAPHQRQTQLNLRCPFKVIWQHPGVTLHIGRVFSNPVQLSVPLLSQNTWTGFWLISKVVIHVISMLRTQHSDLEGWRRLPKIGSHVGTTDARTSNLWEWTHIYRLPPSDYAAGASWDTQHVSDLDTLVKESKFKLAQSLAQSQPLARRLQWTQIPTQPK